MLVQWRARSEGKGFLRLWRLWPLQPDGGVMVILLTGITGTVMRALAWELMKRGHQILALVRAELGTDPRTRLENIGFGSVLETQQLAALAGDIRELRDLFPTYTETYTDLKSKIDLVVHGAASIKFKETPDREIFLTNVHGTEQMLQLADMLGVTKFVYISTTYVNGDAPVSLESNLDLGQKPRNDYERSKWDAEEMVRLRKNGSCSVLRIPIVVGDSKMGEISSFTGYYGFFRPFWLLLHTVMNEYGKDPDSCRAAGIRVDKDGVSIPVYVPCSARGPLNLVPIDWVVAVMADVIEIPPTGKTFNIANQNPPSIKDVIKQSLKILGFHNVTVGPNPPLEEPHGLAKTAQRLINRGIEAYRPYILKDTERFDNMILRQELAQHGKSYADPPSFDEGMFRLLLEYAIKVNFGRS